MSYKDPDYRYYELKREIEDLRHQIDQLRRYMTSHEH